MKRNASYLVQKRDGSREWLRATKLARSIQAALDEDGALGFGDAFELAAAVLRDLALRRAQGPRRDHVGDGEAAVTTAEIATRVERILFASGHARAALRYVAARAANLRRAQALATRTSPSTMPGAVVARRGVPPTIDTGSPHGRGYERN
ncbi:MAG: hypothetical protein IT457_01075 [Planctomycetes bacterium]|nr:hypothetical protein [Planctomycetota bacterium]